MPQPLISQSTLSEPSVSQPTTPQPEVTLVVVPRERFSHTRQSLESIYQQTQIPFDLVYVDGNSPAPIQTYLAEQAKAKNFTLLRTEHYLSPNQARNLGLEQVNTKYLVFMDNDVILSPGWLEKLMQCAEDTDAAVVGPLMCEDEPVHQMVHFAGGESHVWIDKKGQRRLREKMYLQGKRVDEVEDRLKRQPTELAEFHCVLVRRSIFDQLGALDEKMMNTKEHLDFCMAVRDMGEQVYFEPSSVVTYVPGPPLKLTDVHFYMLRWSNDWTLSSLNRIREKWTLSEDAYFTTKYKKLGWRRRQTLIDPFARRLLIGVGSRFLAKVMGKLEHPINRYVTRSHEQRNRQPLDLKS
ncbi:MAG: glycosyltransferase [Cyanobacteria bacterium J06621_3]